jgi:hypothetical protein
MITILLIVLWLATGGVKASAIPVPPEVDCAALATGYLQGNVTGNPNYTGATWSCFDVPKTKETAS